MDLSCRAKYILQNLEDVEVAWGDVIWSIFAWFRLLFGLLRFILEERSFKEPDCLSVIKAVVLQSFGEFLEIFVEVIKPLVYIGIGGESRKLGPEAIVELIEFVTNLVDINLVPRILHCFA